MPASLRLKHLCGPLVLTAAMLVTAEALAQKQGLSGEGTIHLTHRATLSNLRANTGLGPTELVVRTASGAIVVANQENRGLLSVFDGRGAFIRGLGTRGTAYGAFANIIAVQVQKDTLIVFDSHNARATLLTLDGRVHGIIHLPLPPNVGGAVRLTTGQYVLNGNMRTPELFGLPLHVVDRGGDLQRSFGTDSPTVRPDEGYYPTMRKLAVVGHGQFWAAHVNRYVVELWDSVGRRQRTIERHVPWFTPWSKWPGFTNTGPPLASIGGIALQQPDRLLVLIHVADKRWREALRPVVEGGFPGLLPDPYEAYFDTIIEVIDTQTGNVIASQLFPDYVIAFADATHVITFRGTDAAPQMDVWRLEVSSQTKGVSR